MKYSRLITTLCLSAICSLIIIKLFPIGAQADATKTLILGQSITSRMSQAASLPPTAPAKVSDFDADGFADFAVYRPTAGDWYVKGSNLTLPPPIDKSYHFNFTNVRIVPGDYDGDKRTNVALWELITKNFHKLLFPNPCALIYTPTTPCPTWTYQTTASIGPTSLDRLTSGNYDGDFSGDVSSDLVVGSDCGANLCWDIYQTSKGQATFTFGLAGDVIVPGNYDGNLKTDVTVFRNGFWCWKVNVTDTTCNPVLWGTTGDKPLLGDFDGDTIDDFAVIRNNGGVLSWYIRRSSDGALYAMNWGVAPSDIPVPADYNDDGKTDIGVFRPSGTDPAHPTDSYWYIWLNPGFIVQQWGQSGDIPIPAAYVKCVSPNQVCQ